MEGIKMMKLRSRRLFKSSNGATKKIGGMREMSRVNGGGACYGGDEIEWEVRPGGMLVQKREGGRGGGEVIRVRVCMWSEWHDISIGATSTFGELKMLISLATGLEPRAQRLVFKGKEREDGDHLHMVGVRDADKVLLLEDPAIKEKKLHAMATAIKV